MRGTEKWWTNKHLRPWACLISDWCYDQVCNGSAFRSLLVDRSAFGNWKSAQLIKNIAEGRTVPTSKHQFFKARHAVGQPVGTRFSRYIAIDQIINTFFPLVHEDLSWVCYQNVRKCRLIIIARHLDWMIDCCYISPKLFHRFHETLGVSLVASRGLLSCLRCLVQR